MALRAAGKPSPNRGYGKRTPDLEASDNACLQAYSPKCLEVWNSANFAMTEFSEVAKKLRKHATWQMRLPL